MVTGVSPGGNQYNDPSNNFSAQLISDIENFLQNPNQSILDAIQQDIKQAPAQDQTELSHLYSNCQTLLSGHQELEEVHANLAKVRAEIYRVSTTIYVNPAQRQVQLGKLHKEQEELMNTSQEVFTKVLNYQNQIQTSLENIRQ